MTKLQVASFPWDPPPPAPAPASAPAPAATATAPPPSTSGPAQQAATASYTSAQLSPPSNAQPVPLANGLPGPQNVNGHQPKPDPNVKQEPAIKQEPGLGAAGMPPAHSSGAPQYAAASNAPTNLAAQRAMSQLQNQYGARAAASISAIQGFGQGPQGQGQGPMPPRPAGATGQPNQAPRTNTQAQYSQQLANQQAAMQQAQQRPPIGTPGQFTGQRPAPGQQNGFQQSQVDGAGDEFEGVLMRQDATGQTSELGRMDIDRMLHEQIAAKAKSMEGGGLMLPLKQATKHKSIANKQRAGGPAGFDGVDDDIKDEEDEDAINSDLDDPNEVDIEDEDDDENMDQVMLCMYDKVQRVKNKWYVSSNDDNCFNMMKLTPEQEVYPEGWRLECQWQGLRLPQGYR